MINLDPIILIITRNRQSVPDLDRKEAHFRMDGIGPRAGGFYVQEPFLEFWKVLPIAVVRDIPVNARDRLPPQDGHVITNRPDTLKTQESFNVLFIFHVLIETVSHADVGEGIFFVFAVHVDRVLCRHKISRKIPVSRDDEIPVSEATQFPFGTDEFDLGPKRQGKKKKA